MKDALLPRRASNGGDAPWPSRGPWAEDGGPVFTTAMSVMALQIRYRYGKVVQYR